MSWNHRVVRMRDADGTESLHVCEVYYRDSVPVNHTERAVGAVGEDLSELETALDRMRAALAKPILDERDFGK